MKRLFIALFALALMAEAPLPDTAQEMRAKALFTEIRCLTCAGESVGESPSDFAADVRAQVRAAVAAGQSDSQIRQTLAAKFGEQILNRPPFNPATFVLWLSPFAVLLGGIWILWRRTRGTNDADSGLTGL